MNPRSRAVLAGVAALVVVAGVAVARLGDGPWADPAGDALYAALVYLLVLLVAPRVSPWVAAGVATAFCTAVELLQLTGVPAVLVGHVPVLRYALGTTFNAVDLVVYAAAATVAALVDRAATRHVVRADSPRPGVARRAAD
ncbi:hypothetical protein Cch01nite_15790 [Cellulomonas chitinilytica]|uniref:DUF2809 domain-containing protein n=1 Tax=Cellulomonas chitinilytica TaxID=398759 RepID=A0A919TYQ5_9CELL|nr:DUF2809 domain-containing protein [Cellulomonas chitinilytica]GIG20855.1 hypothetical protein Cch01nite_15790 [Cellulomonas chitinilytica]